MNIDTFVLRVADNGGIYAIGMRVTRESGQEEVLTYRRDPHSGQLAVSVFATPEKALEAHLRVMPMDLEWTTA